MLSQDNPANAQPTQPASVSADKKQSKPLASMPKRELQKKLNYVWEQKAKVEVEAKRINNRLQKTLARSKAIEAQEQELLKALAKVQEK
ncbi:hypothetical protein NHP200010_14710 [Helicobacter bizzozeronii]|uniref:hypothetical protein n=1 Tax=Helicobacter bizzozeronii TaxID=56877 RepID=UPI00244D8675|nr:hypothetical protein [Helicobacter bizzozeronii]GMB93743.1 hypothetical protein NHP200010_14710 [Helicobacter bizzozeronii]